MCGICGCVAVNDIAFNYGYNGMVRLLNRGFDSCGCTTINKNGVFVTHKFASDDNEMANKKILKYKDHHDGHISIFHSRWRTTGGKTNENSHPHLDMYENFSLVHNGIIENYIELKIKLENLGYMFKSETDTEIIVNLISHYYDVLLKAGINNISQAILLATKDIEGTYALAIISLFDKNKIFIVRHGSPCLIGFDESNEFAMIASEIYGFDDRIKSYIVIENHDIITLEIYNKKIKMVSTSNNTYINKNFRISKEDQSYAPYDCWTIKEICEQSVSCMRAINMGGRIKGTNEVMLGGFEQHKNELLECENLILLGCGTSFNACLTISNLFKKISGFDMVQVFDGAEFTDNDIPKNNKTCFIFVSQSGETKDLHRCIEKLKIHRNQGKKLSLVGIINVVDSLIAREVDCGSYLNCGREFAVASTKAFSSQLVVLSLVAIWFAQYRKIHESDRSILIKKILRLQNDIVSTIDKNQISAENLANFLKNKSSAFILGKDSFEAIAKEGSLKMKEIGYIHAEAYSSSALKHGPYALLENEFPVFICCPNDKYLNKNKMTVDELVSRGAFVIGISDIDLDDRFNVKFTIPTGGYTEILTTVIFQLISYHLAIKKGVNVDFPRSLSKCVSTD